MSRTVHSSTKNTMDDSKEYIRQLYLVQRKTQKQILKDLIATKKLHVTKSQLEYQLRKWNFRRELSQPQWWYVKRKIEYRKLENKESEVVLSGVPIHQKTVERETARLFLSTLDQIKGITERPRTPENIDLSVCTPKPSEADQKALDALRNLPWARLQGAQVARLLYQTCRQSLEQHGESQVIWLLVSQLLEKLSGSLRHAGECRRLNRITTATQNIDRYAACLGSVIPQGRSQEHFKMLSSLKNQNSSDTQLDALKLLIFSVSNNFVMAWNNEGWYAYSPHMIWTHENDHQEVLRLFQAAVTSDVSIMPRLIEAADTIPAISIFAKRLFDAALLSRSYETAAAILHVIHKDSLWNFIPRTAVWQTDHTPLAMAVGNENIWLTSLLLEAGADPNEPTAYGPTPLENAAAIYSHDTAFMLASLLISHGAAIVSKRSSRSTSALSFAVLRGNFRLIELLVGRGAGFSHDSELEWPSGACTYLADDGSTRLSTIIDVFRPEILAAGFRSIEGPSSHTEQEQRSSEFKSDVQARFAEDQEIACQMVRYMLGQKTLAKTSSLCPEKSRSHGPIDPNVMIMAAYRGYHDVIRILYSTGASATALNSLGASPLSAAALRGDIGTCRLLMELENCYEDPMKFDHEPLSSAYGFPTALQIAAWYDNEGLCEEVLAHGADPNGPHACRVGVSGFFPSVDIMSDQDTLSTLKSFAREPGWNSLRMALSRKSAKVAKCLLANRHIHSPNQEDLLLAANLGDVDVMAKMLKTMRSPTNTTTTTALRTTPSFVIGPQRQTYFRSANYPRDEGVDLDCLTALQVAVFQGHTNIVKFLLESGFEIVGAEAAYAFRNGPITLIQLILDRAPDSLRHKTLDGRSYLEMAFLGGDRYLIQFALGLDSNYYDSGALCAAVVAESDAETIRNLVKRKSGSLKDNDEDNLLFNTALSLAASMRRRDLVQELLPVSVTLDSNCCVAPDRPLKEGFDCSSTDPFLHIHELELDRKWNEWHRSVFRTFSPTFLAVLGEDEKILQDLLTAGYRTDGATLKAAVCREFPIGLNERLVSACVSLEDGVGGSYTPLQEAIVHGKVEWVRLLLRSKADPRARRKRPDYITYHDDPMDRTAFQIAVEVDHQEIADMLLDEGVCVNEPAGAVNGMTALQIAARDGLLGVAIRLTALGADVNAYRALVDGSTALEAAAANGRIDLVQYLLDSGVLTTGTGRRQYLAATKLAERHGHLGISKLLKEHRSWTEEDLEIFEKADFPHFETLFYHPDEYTDDEREDILATIQALEAQWEAEDKRTTEPGGDLFTGDEGEDCSFIEDEARSQSTKKLGADTTVSDDLVMHSHAYAGEAEMDWGNEFDDDVQLVGGSGNSIISQPGDHVGVEVGIYPLQHEAGTAWATGLDVSVNAGFDVVLSAEEERLFEEFTKLQEQV